MAQPPKGGLVRGHDKPIHGSCAIYFPGGINKLDPPFGVPNGWEGKGAHLAIPWGVLTPPPIGGCWKKQMWGLSKIRGIENFIP